MSYVDVSFPFIEGVGTSLPLDHGYSLFSALSRLDAEIHRNRSWMLHLVYGEKTPGTGYFNVNEASRVAIRLPVEDVGYALAAYGGAGFQIFNKSFGLHKAAEVKLVEPVAALYSPLVTFKNTEDHQTQEEFDEELERILRLVARRHGFPLPSRWRSFGTRRLKVRPVDGHVLGRSVLVEGLTPEFSLQIQQRGLGGKCHMGAGIFSPAARHDRTRLQSPSAPILSASSRSGGLVPSDPNDAEPTAKRGVEVRYLRSQRSYHI